MKPYDPNDDDKAEPATGSQIATLLLLLGFGVVLLAGIIALVLHIIRAVS